jgi:hypothetical protein
MNKKKGPVMQGFTEAQHGVRYAVFHKMTGRIIHTHSQSEVTGQERVEIGVEEVSAMLSTTLEIVGKINDLDPDDLDVIRVEPDGSGPGLGALMVDTKQRELLPRPSLTLSADKSELTGDGQDSTQIEIVLADADGQVIEGATGAVKVTTDRGKLSARGGLVELVNGRASISLTSANETVSKVQVRATHVDRVFVQAHLELEFT